MRLPALALVLAIAAQAASAATPDDASVKRIHERLVTIDAHIDIPESFDARAARGGTSDQFDLAKLDSGQLDVATVALFAAPAKHTPANVTAARTQVSGKLEALAQFVADDPQRLAFAASSADIERIAASGKHAILLSFLNALPLGDDLDLLSSYYRDGVRVFGFVHAANNAFADSSRPNSAFGDAATLRSGPGSSPRPLRTTTTTRKSHMRMPA